jgi:hypothetical protein
MGIGKRLRWPFSNGATAVIEAEPAPAAPQNKTAGRLVILVSDAAGFASFKTHTFFDAQEAAVFIKTWYGKRIDKDNGIIAFWAMAECPDFKPEPGSDASVEAIVIIRDAIIDNLVYPFSFVSLNEAHSFMRFELERGANPELLQVYWAVPVQMGITAEGEVRIYPEEPPGALPPQHPANARPVIHMIDWTESSSAGDPLEAIFRKTRKDGMESEVAGVVSQAAEIANVVDDEFQAAGLRDNTAEVQPVAVPGVTGEPAADILPDPEPTATEESTGALAHDTEESATELTADIATTETSVPGDLGVEADHIDVEDADADIAEEPELEPAVPVAEAVEAVAVARPDRPQAPAPAEPVHTRMPGFEFPAARASVSDGPRFDAKEELQKVLRVRRWDEREGPFSGFNSPPGRF